MGIKINFRTRDLSDSREDVEHQHQAVHGSRFCNSPNNTNNCNVI